MPAAIHDWIQLHRDRIVCDPSLVLTTKKRTRNAQNSSETQSGTFSAAISTKQDTSARQPPRIVSWRNCDEPRGIDTNTDPLADSNTARTDYSDTVESMSDFLTLSGGQTINLTVHGGTGGSGGRGEHGGHGGTGEGPKITFPHSNVTLTDPHRTYLESIKEKLTNHIAANHKHTDQNKTVCAENTRVEIQNQIMRWLSNPTKKQIFWITGIAGSGKSTLSATLVDNLCKEGTPVAAQFFISRNVPQTIEPKILVTTIALQLAEFSPAAACIIEAALKHGLPGRQEDQVKKLLLAPIWEICKSYDRVIILIDALDELKDAAVVIPNLLSLLAPKSKNSDLPDKLRFIVTSRPEYWADISRSKRLNPAVFKQKPLTTDQGEVHKFIDTRFQKIKAEMDLEGPQWDNWPSVNQVSKLSTAADGLFHYAATALQWIEQQVRDGGKAARERVFDKFSELGIGHLDKLYRAILTSFEDIDVEAQDTDERKNQLHGFQHVIGTTLVLYEPLTIGQIMALLVDISPDDFDVSNFVRRFRSVLIPSTTTSFEGATPQMHKSFRDYIMGEHAPPEFHIHMGEAHFVTAKSCLEVIVGGDSQSDAVLEYSNRHWYKHLRSAVEGEATFQDEGIWNLLGKMVEETNVKIEKRNAVDVFNDVGTVGWRLLERGTDAARMEKISSILIKAKLVCAAPLSPVLASLTPPPLPVSSSQCIVCAAPLLPVLASLTSPPLLVSSQACSVRAAPLSPSVRAAPLSLVLASFTSPPLLVSRCGCVPLLCHWSLPHSLPLLLLSLVGLVRAAPLSLVLASLTSPPLLVSSLLCNVRAAPLSPVLASLTSPPLLASREECVLLLCCRSLPRSPPLLFLSLIVCAAPLSLVLVSLTSPPLLVPRESRACRSSVAGPCLAHSPLLFLSLALRAAPLLPVLASLTSPPLLVSRGVRAAPLSPVLASLTSPPLLVSRIVRAAPLSPVLASLTSPPLLVSRALCSVRATPLSPVLASLTSPPLPVSSQVCVPLLCCRSLPRSLPLLSLSLELRAASLLPVLASLTSPSSPCLQSEVRAAPLSPVLASLTSPPLPVPRPCEVRAAPLFPVLASLTSPPLLVSRAVCVPLLCPRSLPLSLPLLLLSLEMRAASLSPVLASPTSPFPLSLVNCAPFSPVAYY
ncbi:hypothetical protein MSAN_00155600 [Mycena sanguinolenta]|uniref:NACHT domain-containing protein n=1 Tax=Mycena sanguinolenta TaxID=230812 RepID=A0A8H6ZJ74_9AGAR|nr:hypothetical protein MSAN_00155600 [Mycena sanguinolenta]